MSDIPPNNNEWDWLEQPAPWHVPPPGEPPVFEEMDAPRAPIAPTFEEPPDPVTAEMVGSQAWGKQRVATQLAHDAPEVSLLRETLTATKFLAVAFFAAILVATIFSYWTPDESLSPEFTRQMQVVRNRAKEISLDGATPVPTEVRVVRVGIIAGHSGPTEDGSDVEDPGAVCDDNEDGVAELRELDINNNVAKKVVANLLAQGYEVDLFGEFDPRLHDYRADVLLSIHTNDCRNYGLGATGYNAAGPAARGTLDGADEALVRCIIDRYGETTNLPRHFGVTEDMTSYHNFREVSVDTPVAIIEIGFMFADRQFVSNQQDLIAEGITRGLVCFLDPQGATTAGTVTPQP